MLGPASLQFDGSRDGVLCDDASCKLPKGYVLFPVHFFAQIGLGKDGQGVAGDFAITQGSSSPPNKMRYRLESAGSDSLKCLSCLESNTIPGYLYLDSFTSSRLDIKPGRRIG